MSYASVRSVIVGCGSYLPAQCLTNKDLETRIDTNDEWITTRTGIRQRYIAAEGELTSDLAANAARKAMENAGVTAGDIDLVIVATTTPDDTLPATAVHVQRKLVISGGAAFDVQAVCTGFVYALTVADSLLKTGMAHRALVIGAETFSRILDWEDRGTCVLFGDGAGAVVLEARSGDENPDNRGVLASRLQANGEYADFLRTTGGVSSTKDAGVLTMAGREVFRHAVAKMSDVTLEVLEAEGYTPGDVDWLVPHQANIRILQSVGQKLQIPLEKTVLTVDKHANTSAASIPLALADAASDGRLRPGDLVVLPALGAGLTWGSCLIRW